MTASSRKRNKLERKLQRQAERKADQPAAETPDDKPIRKRAQKLLEAAAHELEQAEIEFLDELFETAQQIVALHKQELRERAEATRKGIEPPKRWQISPGIYDRVTAKALRIIEIRLARRRALKEQPQRQAG